MFIIDDNQSIRLTRGDIAVLEIRASDVNGEDYIFKTGDIVRFKVIEKKKYNNVVMYKDVIVEEDTTRVDISLTSEDTRIGTIINKPEDYWYEVELNPDTTAQTIIGYDMSGPKIFTLLPEGADNND